MKPHITRVHIFSITVLRLAPEHLLTVTVLSSCSISLSHLSHSCIMLQQQESPAVQGKVKGALRGVCWDPRSNSRRSSCAHNTKQISCKGQLYFTKLLRRSLCKKVMPAGRYMHCIQVSSLTFLQISLWSPPSHYTNVIHSRDLLAKPLIGCNSHHHH